MMQVRISKGHYVDGLFQINKPAINKDVHYASSMLIFHFGHFEVQHGALVCQSNVVLKWGDWHVISLTLGFFRGL